MENFLSFIIDISCYVILLLHFLHLNKKNFRHYDDDDNYSMMADQARLNPDHLYNPQSFDHYMNN
jgi:hypothetical protein